jgi:hypothetical protein
MKTLEAMGAILTILVLIQVFTLIQAYRAGQRWPLAITILVFVALAFDVCVLRREGVWFWVSLFL